MKKQLSVILALLMVLLVAACAPQAGPALGIAPTGQANTAPVPSTAQAQTAPAASARAAWEIDWEKTIEAAANEREVVVLTSRPTYRTDLTPLFKKKFGVTLEFIAGTGSASAAKLVTERRAGIYSYDVYSMGAGTVAITLKPAGFLVPLEPFIILPEVTDPKGWDENKLPWFDSDHTTIYTETLIAPGLAINTNLVKPEDLKSYRSLLDPRWKGKIVLYRPFVTGPGSKMLAAMANDPIWGLGWDFLRELKKNDPVPLEDGNLARDWLAQGKIAIEVGPLTAPIIEGMRAGAPIRFYNPPEGGYSTGNNVIAVFGRAPHPSATKLFVNWILSREGQTAASKSSAQKSARADISQELVDPVYFPQPGVKYASAGDEKYYLTESDVVKKIAEIFQQK